MQGTLAVMPPSVSSKTPQSMSTPVLPRAEASACPSTPDASSSSEEEHIGIGAVYCAALSASCQT